MSKTVVIHQPDFIPYLGFFHRLLHADLFVILNDVQFLRRGWHHRDRIKTKDGDKWLTIGIKKVPQNTSINEIFLNDENWQLQHLNLIKQSYAKAKYFEEIFPFIDKLYSQKYEKMIDINLASIKMLLELFDINIGIVFSTEFRIQSKSNQLLVDLLLEIGATHYLSGIGAKDYYDNKPFEEANIKVLWQDFKHPVYPQLHGEFIPYLSSIDLLFNCGIEKSREILRSI
ncbi:WbqC family protein [Aliarcobacter butzleri]|uniref:WbqC family protein n=1 Tax=Aliarcobacter butzleri TaxID=28197 RepID=UPI0021B4A183|nr:WbqC family protein [Aliarcobacter butzleri]MCT7601878.1 WbqC family protein [Aliarcobacter butzleri]